MQKSRCNDLQRLFFCHNEVMHSRSALAVPFTLRPASVTAYAVPPPKGEGFGAVELGRCGGKRT